MEVVKKITSEEDLRDSLIKYLGKQGAKNIVTELNVGCNWAWVDLVYIDEKRRFICIELKMRAWKKVLDQACKLKKMTPFVSIAMPQFKTYNKRRQVQREAEKLGIGVFWYGETGLWQTVAPPEKIHSSEGIIGGYLIDSLFTHFHFTFLTRCIEHGKAKAGEPPKATT